jgi:hypothetical protein
MKLRLLVPCIVATACSAYDPSAPSSTTQSATATTRYVGCYTDSSDRALPHALAWSDATVESCIALAKTPKLAYAGLQYGGQCFGGDTLGYALVATSRCNMPCTEDASEICGGRWLNSVYSTGASCTGACSPDAGRADSADGDAKALDSSKDASDGGKDAGQVFAASCSQADVQNAINEASTGETVNVPGPCSVAWASAVDIPATKGITVKAGGTVTITSTVGFTLESNASAESRITGFNFTGSSSNPPDINIHVTTTPSSSACRVDHNTFTNSGLNIFVEVDGQGPCLVDHNTFTSGPASEMIHVLGANAGSNAGWVDDVAPGGPQMVFIEDNTFTNSGTSTICSAVESYYGSRTVFRHNTLSFCQVDQHGTAGAVGARWWEVYDNDFYTPPGENQCCLITMRGGTGVIWENTTSGSNTHTGAGIDLYEEDTGTWPLAYQVGSGINGVTNGHNSCAAGTLNSSPAYIWGNASSMSVGSQTPTIVVQGRDYFSSATQPATLLRQQLSTDSCSTSYDYVPYTYPHPLQSQ